MSCLENLPNVVLICLLKHMKHEAKLSLRQTSKRMFKIVTAIDETFNYWTFDPCIKEDLPKFILESDKFFQIHIKDLVKKWESVKKDYENAESEDDSNENDDDEERNKEVQRIVKFICKHAQRIVSFKVSCDMDSDEYGLGQDLLDELEDLQPKWENLKSFEVINTNALTENLYYDDLSAHVNDMSKLFKFCQNTLQKLVCVGISLPECQDLRLIDFKALLINSCSGSQEFVKSLAETDNFSHLEEIAIIRCGDSDEEDVDITAFLSSDLSKLKKLDIDQAAVSFEEPLHLKCANLKSIRLTMNDSAAGLEDFLIFCSTTLEVLDLKCGGTDTEDDELDFSKLATQSWNIKDLRLELTNEFRGLNHYKDLEKFLNGCSLLMKLSLEAAGSNTFNAIDSDDMDDYHEDLDDSYNEMKGYSRNMEDNSEEDSGDMEDDIDDDSDNDGEEDKSYEEDTKQTKVNAKSKRKLENLPLKYLHCPTYFLKQISASCCEHISELKIEDSTGGWVGDLKFPGLDVLTVDRKDKHFVDILFENAQVRESNNPLFGYKYERSFINAIESNSCRSNKRGRETENSSCQSKKRARENENSCSPSKKRARETPRNLLTPKARI